MAALVSESTSEEESSVLESSAEPEERWVDWFCKIAGNEVFVDIDEDYLEDDFNLTGLDKHIEDYGDALSTILDVKSDDEDEEVDPRSFHDNSAMQLYGLIHARYILTVKGMQQMMKKHAAHIYGFCPNVMCESETVMPLGLSDRLSVSSVKVYCPRCCECYFPRTSRLAYIDGAFFGPSFAPLFFCVHATAVNLPRSLDPHKPHSSHFGDSSEASRGKHKVPTVVEPPYYTPKIFGFKVNGGLRDYAISSTDPACKDLQRLSRVHQSLEKPFKLAKAVTINNSTSENDLFGF
eukprot:Platyproteum_vivax@DN6621_c0_g1_i1.p1